MLDRSAALAASIGGGHLQRHWRGVWRLSRALTAGSFWQWLGDGRLLTGLWRLPSPAVAACCSWRSSGGGLPRRLWRPALPAAAWECTAVVAGVDGGRLRAAAGGRHAPLALLTRRLWRCHRAAAAQGCGLGSHRQRWRRVAAGGGWPLALAAGIPVGQLLGLSASHRSLGWGWPLPPPSPPGGYWRCLGGGGWLWLGVAGGCRRWPGG